MLYPPGRAAFFCNLIYPGLNKKNNYLKVGKIFRYVSMPGGTRRILVPLSYPYVVPSSSIVLAL